MHVDKFRSKQTREKRATTTLSVGPVSTHFICFTIVLLPDSPAPASGETCQSAATRLESRLGCITGHHGNMFHETGGRSRRCSPSASDCASQGFSKAGITATYTLYDHAFMENDLTICQHFILLPFLLEITVK